MSSRWSYQAIEIKVQLFGKPMTERAQEELSRLGQQGWELVNATHAEAADSIRLFLKKPA
jgi:Domain of unknown function (DUF4177)